MTVKKEGAKPFGSAAVKAARDQAADFLESISSQEQRIKEILKQKIEENKQNLIKTEKEVANLRSAKADFILADKELEACLQSFNIASQHRAFLGIQLDKSVDQMNK